NLVTIPTAALATWSFLRAYETRRASWSIFSGLAAALAMLAKYWSIWLLAGFALAAILGRQRAAFFRSSAPWLIVASGAVAIAPHRRWLYSNDFPTFGYAYRTHHLTHVTSALSAPAHFVAGMLAYL